MDLASMLADPAMRDRVLAEGAALIAREVSSRGGLTGMALKAGFKAIRTIRPDIVEDSLGKLLPAFTPALQPHVDAALADSGLVPYFRDRSDEIAESLLSVTDDKAASAQNPIMKRTYSSLRGQAHAQTARSMPAVGEWLATYA